MRDAVEHARRHARAEYPVEACGFIVGDAYWPCTNEAADPLQDFAISPFVYLDAEATGELRALVHSHPDGPHEPSELDRHAQAAMDIPWIIIPLDTEQVFESIVFSNQSGINDHA